MPGISLKIIQHKLNMDLKRKPVQQRRRAFTPKRDQAITEKVTKLLTAGFICKVYYPDWLTNVVLVKKANGKWRLCMDFMDLNKAGTRYLKENPVLYPIQNSQRKRHSWIYFIHD